MKRRRKKRSTKQYAVIAFYEKNNRWPAPSSQNVKERHLGEWITRCRFIRNHSPEKLTEKQIQLIDRIDADKAQKKTERWMANYEMLKDFVEKEKRWPSVNASEPEEIRLVNWCLSQRITRKNTPKNKLNKEHIKLLDDIGFHWSSNNKRRTWKESFNLVKDYYARTGQWPAHTRDPEESRLAKWCSKMRAYKNRTDTSVTLSPGQIKKLSNLGFDWTNSQENNRRSPENTNRIWIERYHHFCEFTTNNKRYPKAKSGDPQEESLYSWWMRMAYLKRKGKLSNERIHLLDCIGFRWGKKVNDD